MSEPWIKWKRRNTGRTEWVSTYPAGVWQIRRFRNVWELRRAAHDGDPYQAVTGSPFPTVAAAKQAAEDWTP